MDLGNHFTEIQIGDIFPLPFVDKVVKDVCSFQFAESEGLSRRFKKKLWIVDFFSRGTPLSLLSPLLFHVARDVTDVWQWLARFVTVPRWLLLSQGAVLEVERSGFQAS